MVYGSRDAPQAGFGVPLSLQFGLYVIFERVCLPAKYLDISAGLDFDEGLLRTYARGNSSLRRNNGDGSHSFDDPEIHGVCVPGAVWSFQVKTYPFL